MAEFCKQDALHMAGPRWRDWIPGSNNKDPKMVEVFLCEGCGPCYIDPESKCVTHKKHPVSDEELARIA